MDQYFGLVNSMLGRPLNPDFPLPRRALAFRIIPMRTREPEQLRVIVAIDKRFALQPRTQKVTIKIVANGEQYGEAATIELTTTDMKQLTRLGIHETMPRGQAFLKIPEGGEYSLQLEAA